jgi:hypothetical protein
MACRYLAEVTVKGTVTGRWTNPHVMMGLDVMGTDGKMQKWDVGGPSKLVWRGTVGKTTSMVT